MAIGNERSNSKINYRTGSYLDTKPTFAYDGDLFEEIDGNKDLYVYHKGDWIVKTAKTSLVGSLTKLSTEPDPPVVENGTLLIIDKTDPLNPTSTVKVGHNGIWEAF